MHRDPTNPAIQAITMVKLLHELYHFITPIILSLLYGSKKRNNKNAPVKIRPHKVTEKGKDVIKGEMGEAAEIKLCGAVLYLANKSQSFLETANALTLGALQEGDPRWYLLKDAALAKLAIQRFNAQSAAASFLFQLDIDLVDSGETRAAVSAAGMIPTQEDYESTASEQTPVASPCGASSSSCHREPDLIPFPDQSAAAEAMKHWLGVPDKE